MQGERWQQRAADIHTDAGGGATARKRRDFKTKFDDWYTSHDVAEGNERVWQTHAHEETYRGGRSCRFLRAGSDCMRMKRSSNMTGGSGGGGRVVGS